MLKKFMTAILILSILIFSCSYCFADDTALDRAGSEIMNDINFYSTFFFC